MKNRFSQLVDWYFSRKAAPYWAVLAVDCLVVLASGALGYAIVYSPSLLLERHGAVLLTSLLLLPGYMVGMRLFHTYSGILRYSSSNDLIRTCGAMAVGTAAAFAIRAVCGGWTGLGFGNLVLILMFFISTCLATGVRVIVRFMYDTIIYTNSQQRVFVYGVHEGGEALGHSIMSDRRSPYVLSGFISDDAKMDCHRLLGVKVYRLDGQTVWRMRERHIRALFVSPMRNEALRKNTLFLNQLIQAGIKVMMQPAEQEWDGKSDLCPQLLHPVEIEDLLPRDKISVDLEAIGRLLRGQTVLITGAAGSIGYEMARQVAKFEPSDLVLVDQAETPMHTVRLHMAKHYPGLRCETVVTTICNESKMDRLFQKHRPAYVFHAAAYKHVPMMEDNPAAAVQNNICGTRVIADLAVRHGVRKFVMISTDKAVNPTNVMGCSKRICEIYCQALNAEIQRFKDSGADTLPTDSPLLRLGNPKPRTQFVTTRFGNVLGSNGSVIPLFRKQIEQGGPVTVTHPDIIRFFMLIPEACRLVLEAGTMGKGGEIFVFDMGQPVRIADLAQRMIDLSGAKDIEIEYTGLRDGEKLFEEVLSDNEQTMPTPHPKIRVAKVRQCSWEDAARDEDELTRLSYTYDDMAIVGKMKEIVPEYKSRHSKYEALDK